MQKLNMVEATNIIGGGFFTCTSTTYQTTTVGSDVVCAAVSACTNKFGEAQKVIRIVPSRFCGPVA